MIYPGYIASEMNDQAEPHAPMMSSTVKGVRAIVGAVEKEKDHAFVPALPWAPLSLVMRHAPLPLFKRLI